ncbi:helix-turn-helix transcriptional regulator [Nostoc sp. UIC 10630]|uniref:helix-turn-helix transcriptional regulator n=1 Tax=Nostoc sp. UIC 10630 TaxID=2100146 RepID=UPI0013D31C4B|nr:helix-turn-helix transcriptional regulator [Nostoc sp. UIC 10630]NEU79858.1 helix-turn-helix transcriptional regulator [Nostoc sp. UIC 10630]
MEILSQQDFSKILNFVQGLYSTDRLQNFSSYISTAISNLIQADISGYCTIDFMQHQFVGGVLFPAVPVSAEVMNQYFYEHPHQVNYLKTRDCRAYKISDFLTEKQLHRREGLYQKFLRPMNMEDQMTLVIPRVNSMTVDGVTLFSSQRSFTERDRLILNLLLPHLMQAQKTGHILTQIQQENQQLHNSLNAAGTIVISDNGDVQLMTQKAENYLQQYFFCNYSGQSLPEHLQQWVKYQRSVHNSNSSVPEPHLPMKIEQDGKQLVVRFIADPINNQHILILEEQKSPSLTIESLEYLGLSKREAEVLFWVAMGKENSEIAKILGVSTVTIRKHLEHTYQKLNVKTRSAAVVTALQKLGILNCR